MAHSKSLRVWFLRQNATPCCIYNEKEFGLIQNPAILDNTSKMCSEMVPKARNSKTWIQSITFVYLIIAHFGGVVKNASAASRWLSST